MTEPTPNTDGPLSRSTNVTDDGNFDAKSSRDNDKFADAAETVYEFDDAGALLGTNLPLPRRRGKVRDVYDIGDHLLIVSTDRISAFDHILPVGIPGKGQLLTRMSLFWFGWLKTAHHLVTSEVPSSLADMLGPNVDLQPLVGRIMVCRKATVVPFECVVRGYLEGSGWREYQQTAAAGEPSVGGHALPANLKQCDRLPTAIFTPSTKAEEGHDQNVTNDQMAAVAGQELTQQLRSRSLQIYQDAAEYARQRGILIADTKFEFGHDEGGELILIDEVLTPDSSRFWSADDYQPGHPQPSMDKQFVREYLDSTDWDKNSPPPILPPETIAATAQKYQQAHDRLVGPAAG